MAALFFFITNFYESIIAFIAPPLSQLLSDGPGKLHTKGWSLLGHQDCQSSHETYSQKQWEDWEDNNKIADNGTGDAGHLDQNYDESTKSN